jgi:CubicO group peptidase (beta-lactamase class C family)
VRTLDEELDRRARDHGFSGVVRVDLRDEAPLARAYGLAERGLGVPNTTSTRFGLASAAKGVTALTVGSLLEEGRLSLDTQVRDLLRDDLPDVDDEVTVEHLLAHRSGIGDYLDEEEGFDPSDYVLPVPVHELSTTEAYLPLLRGRRHKFRPGERFSYCNSGYVVLALVAERAAGQPFHALAEARVLGPAGMAGASFLRSDELPGDVARGYLDRDGLRTNVLHLPVRGSGDGGLYASVGDVHLLWDALFAGRIAPDRWVAELLRPRSDVPEASRRYALGFWLHGERDAVILEGFDAGVSFRSVHDRATDVTYTVVANDAHGAWPLARYLEESLLR